MTASEDLLVDRNKPGIAAELLDLVARPAWHADAACHEHPELTWFPAKGEDQTAAKAVCSGCLVLAECRAWALQQGAGLVGIWGGLSGREGRGHAAAA